jgi:O-antigen ligase
MNSLLKNSMTIRIIDKLFVNERHDLFKSSKTLKIFSRFSHQPLAVGFLSLSLASFFYESWFFSLGISSVSSFNLATIFLLSSLIFCDKNRLESTKQVLYLFVFVIILLISGLVAAINGLQMGMIFSGSLLFSQFVFAYFISSTIKNKKLIINMILVLTFPLLLVGIYQIFWGGETSRLWVSASEALINIRIFGFFGSPNVFASVLMLTMIMSTFRLMESKKWYYASYLLVALILIIFTFSRSAWLGLIISLVIALFIKNWRFLLMIPASFGLLIFPSIRQRVLTATSQEYMIDSALDGRVWATNNAWEIFKTSPIVGTGPGSYGGQTAITYSSPIYLDGIQNGYIALAYTDNQWAQIMVQTGLIGVLSLIGFFVSHLINNLRQYKQSGSYLALGIIAASVALFINGMFANILEFGAVSVLAGTYLGLGNSYESR